MKRLKTSKLMTAIGLDDLLFLIVLATPFIAVFSFAAGVLYPFYT